jgi:ferrous iron transport protein B
MKLSNLHNGESAVIVKVYGHGGFRKRITEMGFVRGRKVGSILNSPLNDPVKYSIMGYEVSLRHSEAEMIEVLYESDAEDLIEASGTNDPHVCESDADNRRNRSPDRPLLAYRKNVINIALVGNPNSGKTSLFNALSGSSEHVGNYSGVTVDAKTGHFNFKGYHFNITDLPGTYSLSAYSPEERFVRRHIFEKMPDVIVNTVVASNIERNLYLTTELIDLNPRMVVALTMYDELQAGGAELDYGKLGGMIGVPMIPTVARMKKGLEVLLDTVVDIFENRSRVARHIHIPYGTTPEPEIVTLAGMIRQCDDAPQQFPARYWAIKLLENDREAEALLSRCSGYERWKEFAGRAAERIEHRTKEDTETVISDAKYGFIAGALRETFTEGTVDSNRKTRYIDRLVTHKWLGFPIFILLMWIMFMATFYVGSYPQDGIELGVGKLGDFIAANMSAGPLKDLLIGGVIGGVGSVIVFLPNILILYLFISFMEDSGYMARAAFIMDRIMHGMGLHGKSFIPLIMGFGCNVPAIMATRTIESHSSRLITILINPFMSCSARLPVFVLLAGAFFPDRAGTVLVFLYLLGIAVAILTARLLRKTLYKKEETPFVMELPPYRMPTLNAIVRHMWDKGEQYLKKMGGVILVASLLIWFLGYYPQHFPRNKENVVAQTFEDSYLGKIGKFCEPVMRPLGFDWKATVALLAGTTAKEIVVSTLGVLHKNEDEAILSKTLTASGDFSQRSALAFMVFILLYSPCIAALAAVRNEAGRKWALFTVLYGTAVAWITGFAVYTVTGFF